MRGGACVLALLALALWGTGTTIAQSPQPFDLEVSQCDPETGACEEHTEIVIAGGAKPKPRPTATPRPAAEVHDYSLKTGKGTVRNPDGTTADTVQAEVDAHGDEQDAERHKPVRVRPEPATMPTVETVGGGAGGGSPFEYVSADEALAQFAVPPFLVPIYVAAGRAYGIPWNVLASINRIETDFGRNVAVSSAGAVGWMQFMPATWERWGVDASGDGVADPHNPVDAIYAAARYLKASGGDRDLRRAVFAYNHADWYVDSVLKTASVYGSLPSGLVAETGSLAFGRFPVRGRVSYGDDFRRRQLAGDRPAGGVTISGRPGATVIATQDVTVERVLVDRRTAATARYRRLLARRTRQQAAAPRPALDRPTGPLLRRLVAAPPAPRLGYARTSERGNGLVVRDSAGNRYRYSGLAAVRPGARPGARLEGGTVVGHLPAQRPELEFAVKAAGGGAVDPRPLLDGYRLQEAADFPHAVDAVAGNPFVPSATLVAGGVVRGTDRELAKRVLDDPGLDIYGCGREDISRGAIDRRVLAMLVYLRKAGLELTVTSLTCGHGYYTAGGNVSAHSYGAAVDIAAFNGQPVTGNQGPGSLTEQAIRLLMQLDGDDRPTQLISLMEFGGPSFAMADHHDHLHVGYSFESSLGLGRTGGPLGSVTFGGAAGEPTAHLERSLSDRLARVRNPRVRRAHGPAAVQVEAEDRTESEEAHRLARKELPIEARPAAAPARLLAIDVPRGGEGDEAYAIGTVSGHGRAGWADRQTALLRHRDGRWSVVGVPRDAHGKIVNPALRALSTLPGGDGYAVGDRGSIVRFRRGTAPVLVRGVPSVDLHAVVARRRASLPAAVAVGDNGVTVRLRGGRGRTERVAGRPDLRSVAMTPDGAIAAGEDVVVRETGAGWSRLPLRVPGAAELRIDGVGSAAGTTWVSGAVGELPLSEAAPGRPLVARLGSDGWTTYCSGRPELAGISELHQERAEGPCDRALPTGIGGTAGAVAATRAGAVVATDSGLHLLGEDSFHALPGGRTGDRVALSASGAGWALTPEGALLSVSEATTPTDAGTPVELPLRPPATGAPGAIAVTPDGDDGIAVADAGAATWGADDRAAATASLPLHAVALAGSTPWAIDVTGTLVRLDHGRWVASGESEIDRQIREALRDALADAPGTAAPGLRALTFASDDEGYAVGAAGAIRRFDGDNWRPESSPTGADLAAVAAVGDRAVAAGAGGVLLEREDGEWHERFAAGVLAGGGDFTAAAALPDGTLLAAAGGTILASPGAGQPWRVAALPPLGLEVTRLLARPGDGLRVLAVVEQDGTRALLAGDASGWAPVALPAGFDLTDAAVAGGSGEVWASGRRDGRTAVLNLGRP